MSEITLRFLAGRQITEAKDGLLAVYGAAFSAPPYSRDAAGVAGFGNVFERHVQRDEFRLLVACTEVGRIVGFTYSYRGAAGQWWHDNVARSLDWRTRRNWLTGSCEFVELAVDPAYQGRGIGGRLHDTLLLARNERTAVLSTLDANTTALHLYRRRGWVTLLRGFHFSTNPLPWLILGLDLARFKKEFAQNER